MIVNCGYHVQGRGFNSGVILMKLKLLRELGWMKMWHDIAQETLVHMLFVSLADQVVFTSISSYCVYHV